jgi:hypothetical protein
MKQAGGIHEYGLGRPMLARGVPPVSRRTEIMLAVTGPGKVAAAGAKKGVLGARAPRPLALAALATLPLVIMNMPGEHVCQE